MILIADSGSTKTTWSIIDDGKEFLRFSTEGYNPYFVSNEYIVNSIKHSIDRKITKMKFKTIHFYGAGCDGVQANIVAEALKQIFDKAEVLVHLDLLAAARGVLGRESGFVAILGTGTNTCLYNGEEITHNIDSLGFILGDEGSGAYLGKKVLSDYLRENMPVAVKQRFEQSYQTSSQEIIQNIYKLPLANRYCATYSRFLHSDCAYSVSVLKTAFRKFFSDLVVLYPGYEQYKFNCIGSVGFVFKSILKEVAQEFGIKVGKVLKSPIDGLIEYHRGY